MKSSSLRQVIVAITLAVSAAVAHGAWFATTDATSEGAHIASVRLSHWDHYQQKWLSTIVVSGETLRNSEGAIVELRPMASGEVATLSGLNFDVLDADALASLGIPQATADNTVLAGSAVPAPVAQGTAAYIRLKVSTLSNNPQPPIGHVGPWSGPTDPTVADLSATDVGGSVGIHGVTLSTGSDSVDFTWDIGRWAKGDVFLGLNEASYKVIDRDGNFKRFVATADYLDSRLNDYTLTTGCATNWKTGEVFATNFGEGLPAINVITRHPDASLDPAVLYSPVSRRFSTKVTRPDQPDNYYGIDQSPESIVFDGNLNMYVGNSFGNFSLAPAAWANDPAKKFEDADYGAEYTTDVRGLPLENWIDGEQWGWVVDENGVRVLLAPQGSGGPYRERIYGVEVSARMNYRQNGAIDFARPNSVAGLPDWPANLPTGYWSDPASGQPMVTAAAPTTKIPYRWSMGKRLHRYNNTNNLGAYSDADRNAFWTFTGRQGTDWIDLDVTGSVMYYTSEDSFIHRYNVVDGVQLPDVGAALPSQGKLLEGDNRFHGLRILPPGDGTGGFLVATRLKIARFNKDGVLVQEYAIHDDPYLRSLSPNGGRVAWWYTLEVDPGGRTFWASAHDSGWVYQFDIASGRELKRLEAVNYRANGHMDGGRRVEGICVMWEYTAPQEICFKADGSPDGIDNDLDGFIDENCHRIEICSALSPGDDDGDNLPNQYDPDCSAELPPVAIDDAYRMRQKEFTPVTRLTVPATDGVLKRGDDDHDRDADSTLTVNAGGTTEALLAPLSATAITTTKGGSVVLQADGSFVYTPLPEFHGVDTFAYRITDGYPSNGPARDIPTATDQDDIATVTIIVEPKVANDGTYEVMVGQTVSRGATGADALLANDAQFPTASSAGPVTVLAAWDPLVGARTELVNGTRTFFTDSGNRVTVNADGSFSFEATNPLFAGIDTFSYDVHDTVSRSWNIATVSVNVYRPSVTISVADREKVYDGTPLPTTCTIISTSLVGPYQHTLTYVGTTRGGQPYGPTATAPTNAGNYTATCVYNDPLLGVQTDSGTVVITPRPLTAKANDKTITLGSPLPTLDGTLTGVVVAGDVINVAYASSNTGTVAGVFPGVLVPTVSAGGSTVFANYVVTEIPGTLTVTTVVPCSGNNGYLTYSQGGWGSNPSGSNPGAFLAANFSRVYTSGFARIGGTKALTFTSAAAIAAFLPQGGSSNVLSASATNPTSSSAGNFAAQLLAMQLAADFSRAGVTKAGLGSLTMLSGPLAGKTVDEILTMANRVIGGDVSALPSGMSLSSLSGILESLNMNFHEGTVNEGLLSCGGTPPCSATQIAFTGSSSVTGTAGNIRTFSSGSVSVKASAFSRVKGSGGAWSTAYLGVWSEGLGVTDTSESGSNDTHKTDNNGRLNYVLFEFSQPVIVSKAFLDSVSGDSDATVWVGTRVNPFTNHLTLSDALLTSLGSAQASAGGSSDRWAEFNDTAVSGNVVVIAADVAGSNDSFKISKLQLECGAVAPEPVVPTIAATGGTFVYTGAARTGTCTVTGENGLALPGTLSYSPGSSAPSVVGNYTVTCAFAGDASYSAATATASLTITPAPLTVIANNKTKAQGTANPSLDGVLTGVVGGDAITATYSTTATTSSPAGTYPIVPSLVDPGGRLSNYSVTKTNGTLTVTPAVPACTTSGYLTYSQGGWGSSPSGNNPGAFLAANFSRVYSGGQVQIGGTKRLTFTSASAIEKFLPQGGSSSVLTSNATNPTKSSAGNFAAQLLALRLAVDFSAAGVTKRGLGGLVMQSGPLAGLTVDAILSKANSVIGGNTSALPSGMSISTLSSILESLNMNFHEGTVNEGLLRCSGA